MPNRDKDRAPHSAHRPPAASMPTNLIQLSPDFMEALRNVAEPKKKRPSKVWWVLGVLVVATITFFAVSRSGRAWVARVVFKRGATTAATAPSAAPQDLAPVATDTAPVTSATTPTATPIATTPATTPAVDTTPIATSPIATAPATATATATATKPAGTTGEIKLPARAAKARVFVDGKLTTHDATPLSVACGKHTVKIGWEKAATVEVPCGGSVDLP